MFRVGNAPLGYLEPGVAVGQESAPGGTWLDQAWECWMCPGVQLWDMIPSS